MRWKLLRFNSVNAFIARGLDTLSDRRNRMIPARVRNALKLIIHPTDPTNNNAKNIGIRFARRNAIDRKASAAAEVEEEEEVVVIVRMDVGWNGPM